MIASSSCSWCHHANPITEDYCDGCGHEAHNSRKDCRCSQCVGSVSRRPVSGPYLYPEPGEEES